MSRVRWENFTQQTDQLVTAMERCLPRHKEYFLFSHPSGTSPVPRGFNRLATDLANERLLVENRRSLGAFR